MAELSYFSHLHRAMFTYNMASLSNDHRFMTSLSPCLHLLQLIHPSVWHADIARTDFNTFSHISSCRHFWPRTVRTFLNLDLRHIRSVPNSRHMDTLALYLNKRPNTSHIHRPMSLRACLYAYTHNIIQFSYSSAPKLPYQHSFKVCN